MAALIQAEIVTYYLDQFQGVRSGGQFIFPAGSDAYLVKTDANGDTLWSKTYGVDSLANGLSVRQTQDGGYIIVGYTDPNPFLGRKDVYLIRTNVQGDTLWTKTYGGLTSQEEGRSVQQTYDGGYIVAGSKADSVVGTMGKVFLVKTDAQGDTLWTRTYRDTSTGSSVWETQDSGYIIAGVVGPGFNADVYLIKTDTQGDTLWTKTYGGMRSDEGRSVQQTSDQGLIIAGSTNSFTGNYDVYLIKTDPYGNVGVEEFSKSPGAQRFAFNVMPSPVREGCAISFALPVSGRVSLVVYDALGRRVRVLLDEKVEARSTRLHWDGRDAQGRPLPSGVYFLRLEAGSASLIRKVVVVR